MDKPTKKPLPFGYNPRAAARHARFRKLKPLSKAELRKIVAVATKPKP